MNNFKKEGFRKGGTAPYGKPSFGGGKKFGGGNRGGDRSHGPIGDGREREMFKAKCSACFKTCEVPFRPTNGKPVYCRECFANTAPSDRPSGRGDSRGGDFRSGPRTEHRERPAFREEVRAPRENDTGDLKRQITNLESKVDHILELLKSRSEAPLPVTQSEAVVEAAPKKVRKPKIEKKKAPTNPSRTVTPARVKRTGKTATKKKAK